MARIDAATAEQVSANLAAKVAGQTATPGGEAAVRRLSDGIAAGKPNYGEMSEMLASATKNQLAHLQPAVANSEREIVTFRK